MERTLIEKIRSHAETYPDKLAVAFKNEQLTYQELYEKITLIGTAIHNLGIKKNDRVLVSAISKPELVAVYLGIQYVGGAVVFVDKNATVETINAIYNDYEASLLLTSKPLKNLDSNINFYSLRKLYNSVADSLLFEYNQPDDNDLAELILTTGTTGIPKGVKLSYLSVRNILLNTIEGIGITKDDRLLLALPLNHSLALRNLRAYLWVGASVVLQNGFAFIQDIDNNLKQYHCTGMVLVPAIVSTLITQLQDRFSVILGSLRYIEVGAGALTTGQRLEVVKLLPHIIIINTWGCSECGGVIFLNVNSVCRDKVKIAALGSPLPHIKLAAVDEQGNTIAPTMEQPGKLALKGDMCMVGYWKQPELTQRTLINGWLITNDLIYNIDDYIYMLGRADDIINVGGEKLSPVEIENIASQYDAIYECACIGVKDPEGVFGEIPVLYYVPRSDVFSVEELESFLVSKLERFKIPRRYVHIAKLPRNNTEKIDRVKLKKMWVEQF